MENIFKEKVSTLLTQSSRSAGVPEVCDGLVRETTGLAECHLAQEVGGYEGVTGG